MNEAFREVTGHTARLKPESFDLSVLLDGVGEGVHWITAPFPNGTVERDTPVIGKATSYSEVISCRSLWNRLEEDKIRKKNKIERDREWELVHGHH